MLTLNEIKKQFPIFKSQPGLVYLDSTATALKPQSVIDKLKEYYEQYSANVFRGVYRISEKATAEYEDSRKIVADFINAKDSRELIFTRGSTEGLNLIAYSLGREIVEEGDEMVTTIMEHHSNFVPWQQLAMENGASLKVIDINESGKLLIDNKELNEIITEKTKILALTYVSNVLGTINPVKEIIAEVKRINPKVIVVVDAAQAVPHQVIDVQDLGCDFLVFSGHKMLGPTGVGGLWGRYEILDKMFPFQFGGDMIEEVLLEKTTFKKPPQKFEAGTPAIAEVIALKEAVKFLQSCGLAEIQKHEESLVRYTIDKLNESFGSDIKITGPRDERTGIVAFTFKKYHPHDIAQILDEDNVAVRAGHHCAMPLHRRLKLAATVRASFYLYNNEEDTEKLIKGLKKVNKIL
jgi:cysteine desulfurase / selenocysteine lyase